MLPSPSRRAWPFVVPTALAAAFATFACGSKTGLLIDGIAPEGPDAAVVVPAVDAATMPATVPCVNGTFSLTAAQPEVVFLIDRSGSMDFGIDGMPSTPSNPSRWTQLASALAPVLSSIQGTVQMGAKFFPQRIDTTDFDTATACAVDPSIDVAPALGNAAAITGIFQSTTPRGGTPTAAAVAASAAILTSSDTRAVSRFMVLATDGAPNCAPDGKDPATCVCTAEQEDQCRTEPAEDGAYSCLDGEATVLAIKNAFDAQKIPTFVIGIGQSERPDFAAVLDQMAVAGGRPRATSPHYYQVLVDQDLTDAFTQIQTSITQCTFVTPSKPDYPDAIYITVNGVKVQNDPTHQNGWDYVNKDFGEIELFGAACELAKMSAAGLTATVDCSLTH